MDFTQVPDPTLYAVPFFLVLLVLERWLLGRARRSGRDVLGMSDHRDTWASLAMGLGSLVFVTLINAGVFTIAGWLYPHRFFDLGGDLESAGPLWVAAMWALALVGWDFAYYWHHRLEHEVRIFWACHVSHHSSEQYNLSTALRQPWTPLLSLVLYPPLALLGVPPWLILVSGGLNLLYQFWVHTEVITRMPTWFEGLFNTPSHHRVHHGSNLVYLDKNYGGIFIVWDRLFGTFQEERERVVYGLTKNIHSYNPLVIATHEYLAIAKDVAKARSVRDALRLVWGHPGGTPPTAPD